jgi:hypothetical protein
MPANPQQRPPKGLLRAGRALWRDATKDYVFDPAEEAVLLQMCRISDHLDALEGELLTKTGDFSTFSALVTGSRGQPVVNPVLQEIRLQSLALAKLAVALNLPDPKAASPRRKGRLSSVESMVRRSN